MTVTDIANFVQTHSASSRDECSSIPSAIISAGPSIASHATLFQHICKKITSSSNSTFVPVTASGAPNLKTLLKNIIQKATSSEAYQDDEDDELPLQPAVKQPRLLNYDLQILCNWVEERGASKVVVAFQDCEALDGALLSSVIELFSCWIDRIPFVLLFGIATSIENFQAKLTRRAARCIDGQQFDTVKAESALERVFATIHTPETRLWLGPGLCTALLRRQTDHMQSLHAFVDSVQYAYMTAFYANATTQLLGESASIDSVSPGFFEALRNLPSFREHASSLLDEQRAPLVRSLLESDNDLFVYAQNEISSGRESLSGILGAVDVLHAIQSCLPNLQQTLRSSLVVDSLDGRLADSSWIRNLMLSVRRASSNFLNSMLERLIKLSHSELHPTCERLLADLKELLHSQGSEAAPLRSEEDLKNSTLRTTIVAKKVELSKAKSTLTKGDAAYSSLLRRFSDALDGYLNSTLIDPKTLVFHEIFIYDLKSPHRDVFTPKPRFAVERALASPNDYLNCECCAPKPGEEEESTLSATQPATAILYQLYLESGAIINVSDLRSAFVTIVGGEERDESETAYVDLAYNK